MNHNRVCLVVGALCVTGLLVQTATAYLPPLPLTAQPTPEELNDNNADPNKTSKVGVSTWLIANAAWWGYDPNDPNVMTASIQAAVNTNVPTVFVPYMGSPWVLSDTIELNPNQVMVLEPGVQVVPAEATQTYEGWHRGNAGVLRRQTDPSAMFSNGTVAYVYPNDPCEPTPGELNDSSDPNGVKRSYVTSSDWSFANAAWWGFDPNDPNKTTSALQAAIDSSATVVYVPYMGSPWTLDETVELSSNQTLFLEPGVEVVALEGAFQAIYEPLFRLQDEENAGLIGYGAAFRMHKEDYQNNDPNDPNYYVYSEWRHALAIYNSKNITVAGVQLENSGGDGIGLGASENTLTQQLRCENIHITDCKMIGNYRQGLSIGSVIGCYVERCLMGETSGVKPRSGIDIEAGNKIEPLQDITIQSSILYSNDGSGMVASPTAHDANSPIIDILIKDVLSLGNHHAFYVNLDPSHGNPPPTAGQIQFEGCTATSSIPTVDGTGASDVIIKMESRSPIEIGFTDCTIGSCPYTIATAYRPFYLQLIGDVTASTAGVSFNNTRVIQNNYYYVGGHYYSVAIGSDDWTQFAGVTYNLPYDPNTPIEYPLTGTLSYITPDPNSIYLEQNSNDHLDYSGLTSSFFTDPNLGCFTAP